MLDWLLGLLMACGLVASIILLIKLGLWVLM
jgi:hypothetical protein